MPLSLAELEARFWPRVDPHGPWPPADLRPDLGRCWRWLGAHFPAGYGLVYIGERRATTAHRVAWGIANGELPPPGLRFRHFACEAPGCVNPAHVRPRVAAEGTLGWRWSAAWNDCHERCPSDHLLDDGNRIDVPGGISCRACRIETARGRRAQRTVPAR